MEFLSFLANFFTHLSWSQPAVIGVAAAMVCMAFLRLWLPVVMTLGLVVIGKAVEFYAPEAMGGIVGDMNLVQVIHLVGGIIVVIIALGQMTLKH